MQDNVTQSVQLGHTECSCGAEGGWGKCLTFHSADLRHEGPHIPDRQPVGQALAPDQRVLVNDAVHPAIPKDVQVTGPPSRHQAVLVVPEVTAKV